MSQRSFPFALLLVVFSSSLAYADIAPPPQKGAVFATPLLVALPILACIAGAYLWSRRRVS